MCLSIYTIYIIFFKGLCPDSSGKFASLRHRDSFFVVNTEAQREADGTDYKPAFSVKKNKESKNEDNLEEI